MAKQASWGQPSTVHTQPTGWLVLLGTGLQTASFQIKKEMKAEYFLVKAGCGVP